MDSFNNTFGYMMGKAMTMVAYCTLAAYVEEMLKAERKKLTTMLGHEPTQENWQDYYDLQQEKTNRQKTRQREADREKLRHLVMGDGDGSPVAG
jgi:hypothetical protein